MEKKKIKYAETMVNYGCNLSCIGCSNFADYPHKGFPDLEKFKKSMQKWNSVVDIQMFGLLGGEPLLNPKLKDWIYGTREVLPKAGIQLITNGVLLDKKAEVIDWLIDISPSKIMITLHRDSDRKRIINSVTDIISKNKNRFIHRDNPVDNEKLMNREWILVSKNKKFSIHVIETDYFLKRYKGYGNRIYPYHTEDIQEAYSRCVDRPTFVEGKLFKCSKMALLKNQLSLTGQINSTEDIEPWEAYLTYDGLSYDDAPEFRESFLEVLYKAEEICKSCPGLNDDESNIDHKSNTFTKQQWLKQFGQDYTTKKTKENC